ncbi:ABC transporter permease [Christensenella tenuis]|jgi:ribose/xylose/arabinose/galactoside ABC-type transport system permease subunit|uniref:ABC transporter permease n=1 Tax=Christensenella tenuis TaxID=2763033 RepID=A0ABR7ED04_9FIRM|nr:ABC transporter permease [Christensenella tenuis]MBC5647626.1 ABC transporter permease [Christensenella tenuis]
MTVKTTGIKEERKGLIGAIKNSGTTFSLVIVYIIMCIIFGLLSPHFFTVNNFLNIGIYSSIIGVMGAGVTVAMLLGAMDISQYATATLASIVAAMLLQEEVNLFVVIIAAIAVGISCGAVNGVLVAVLKIPAIIVTLGTMQIFRGIAYLLAGGKTIMIKNADFDLIGKGYIGNTIPICIVIMVLVFILIYYLLRHTGFGRTVYAVGGNESASYLSGINVVRVKFLALVLCGVCSAVAGLITSSQVGAAIPSNGVGSEMGVLSAVILGGISLSGGKGRISGTIIGVLILATIQNGLTLLSVQSFYQMIINGIVLILAVLMDVIRRGVLKKQ